MLQTILLVVMILISVALTGVVLLQRSEGGALGMGGGPTGFMTARGAGNLLTKTTWVLGALFAICALSLTILGNMSQATGSRFNADDIGQAVGVTQPAGDEVTQEQLPPPTADQAGGQETLSLDSLPVGDSAGSQENPPAQ